MFLKSLVVRGFKSFAEKTTLVFEPGITIVVGPNGSGKSNVVDAISWVLGEQGPRSLRGGRMEDVIFAGSPKRPALGMAEVSLTIDNSAKLLPIEFSEVKISRTLFRSGDSEYRLNNVPCRLLDIQEVLSDTGVGREQHTIVGQGRLDEVLNAGPDQLRGFIEEAAGVGKYRRRKERAVRKIASTEQNIMRLSDLLAEVRRQLRPLREQAEVAKRQHRATQELSRIQLILAGRQLSAARKGLGSGGAASDLHSVIEDGQLSLTGLDERIEDAERRRLDAGQLADIQKEAAWRLSRAVERLSALSRLAEERARSLEAVLAVETEMAARIRVDELRRQADEFEKSLVTAVEQERQQADLRPGSQTADPLAAVREELEALAEVRKTMVVRSKETSQLYRSTFSELEDLAHRASEMARQPSRASAAALSRSLAILQSRLPQIESTFQRFEEEIEKLAAAHKRTYLAQRNASTVWDESQESMSMATARRRVLQERLDSAKSALESAKEAVSKVAGRRQLLADSMAQAGRISEAAGLIAGEVTSWGQEALELYEISRRTLAELDTELMYLKSQRSKAAQDLEETRKQAREQDLSKSEATLRARMLEEKIRQDWRMDPDEIVLKFGHLWERDDDGGMQILDPLDRLAAMEDEMLERRRARLERDLVQMGQVNPLASDQFEALAQREQFLSGQLNDLRSSRRDLQRVVDSVDGRIQELFQTAFTEVADQYERLFGMLFPGGRGRLTLSDSSDSLGRGVEVEARPGGKNLKRLSLLSGGERALSALAVLFAIFRARPSPFYILDEVEAALDDVNLHRFLELLQEFRDCSQMLVVTHQKRTMEIADVLYGVSIGSDGASKVISERLSGPPGVLEGSEGLVG